MTEPTPHDNPDVVAAINAAMDDWEHAGDAFRYVAPWDEPVVRDPSGLVEDAMATGMDGYAAHALTWYELRVAAASGRHAFAAMGQAFIEVERSVSAVVEDLRRANRIPSAEPTDPRERALAARKTRNTGPPVRGMDGRPR